MDWFSLALLSAFSLATADAAAKKWLADCSGLGLMLVRLTVPALMLLPFAIAEPLPAVPLAFWGWLMVLVPLELLAMWLYSVAIRDTALYLTLPYLAFTPVFNVLTGWLFLGETVSPTGLFGILLVVAGTWLLNVRRDGLHWRALLAPFMAVLRERGSRMMLGVAAIYSMTSVGGKAAMEYASPTSFGPFYYLVVGGTAAAGTLLFRPDAVRILSGRLLPVAIVGFTMAAMVMTHFLAIARIEVAYMVAVKRTSLLFGMLYGALVFGERDLARNLSAGVLMVAGVTLILGGSRG